MYIELLKTVSKQDLIEIYDNINKWKWDNRLGEKPIGWDSMPEYIPYNPHNSPNKYDITKLITNYIESKISRKDLFKYHHIKNCNMTRFQHEMWWIKYSLSKILKIGFFSKKQEALFSEIIGKTLRKQKEEWIHKTYYNN